MAWQPFLRYAANLNGRDFIVGDIHGAFDLVLRGMRTVRFRPDVDRLFFVGDLVDRGPESARVQKFLQQPYVHGVRGNHEDELVGCYKNCGPGEDAHPAVLKYLAKMMRADWFLELETGKRLEIVRALAKLPLAIEVETSRGTVGIIHAEVPPGMNWPTFISKLKSGNDVVRQACLTGRQRIQGGDNQGVEGVGRLFVGHTIGWSGIQKLGNVYAIDGGAIFGLLEAETRGRLNMVNIAARTTSLVSTPPPVNCVTTCDDTPPEEEATPFGRHNKPT